MTDQLDTPAADMRPTAEIVLDFPILVAGATVSTLTMRRPKVGDSLRAKKIGGDDQSKGLWLLAQLCGLAPNDLEQMDEVDLDKLERQYVSFRPRSATTS